MPLYQATCTKPCYLTSSLSERQYQDCFLRACTVLDKEIGRSYTIGHRSPQSQAYPSRSPIHSSIPSEKSHPPCSPQNPSPTILPLQFLDPGWQPHAVDDPLAPHSRLGAPGRAWLRSTPWACGLHRAGCVVDSRTYWERCSRGGPWTCIARVLPGRQEEPFTLEER